jgi:drug/metabolite transporter (DMT)-like permease
LTLKSDQLTKNGTLASLNRNPNPSHLNQPNSQTNPHLLAGVLAGLAAGALWGLVFVAPLWLKNYPPMMLSFGRYAAFGLIALPIAWSNKEALKRLSKADWIKALQLSLVGNIIYYCCIAAAVQLAGAPVTAAIIGTLPIVIAIFANLAAGEKKLAWIKLAPSLMVMLIGLILVNRDEFLFLLTTEQTGDQKSQFFWGLAMAIGGLVAWTWYPIKNTQWIKNNPKHSSSTWATAQGLATLPLGLLGLATVPWLPGNGSFNYPLGPTPLLFVGLMLLLGFACSWLGTLCWNRASQLLPSSLAGQMIIFETLFALAYAFVLRQQWPSITSAIGIALLMLGVLLGMRVFQNT